MKPKVLITQDQLNEIEECKIKEEETTSSDYTSNHSMCFLLSKNFSIQTAQSTFPALLNQKALKRFKNKRRRMQR